MPRQTTVNKCPLSEDTKECESEINEENLLNHKRKHNSIGRYRITGAVLDELFQTLQVKLFNISNQPFYSALLQE